MTAVMSAPLPSGASSAASGLITFPAADELLYRLTVAAELQRAERHSGTGATAEVEGVPVVLLYGLDDGGAATTGNGMDAGQRLPEILASAFGGEQMSARDALWLLRNAFSVHLASLDESARRPAQRELASPQREQAYLLLLAGRAHASAVIGAFLDEDRRRDPAAGRRAHNRLASSSAGHGEAVQTSYVPPEGQPRRFAPWGHPAASPNRGAHGNSCGGRSLN